MPVLSEIETRPQIASSYEEILSQIENDLEPVIIDTAPQLGKLLLECQEINSARSAFTGSGSVIFALPVSRAGFSEETAKQFRMLAQRRDARAIEVKLLTQKQQNCFICSNHNAI